MKTTNTTLANALVFNNRFATAKLNAEQLTAEDFNNWKTLISNLHRSAYKTYVQCENSGMKADDTAVDKSDIYAAIKVILASIGDVNGRKLYANEETAITIISYAGRRGNVDAPELQLVNSRISNSKKELRLAETMNGLNPEYIDGLKAQIAELEAHKAELLKTADMRYKQPTKTSDTAFRLDVEHYFARVICGQLAKTQEQLDAEAEARKAERAARRKEKKANASK